jgi:heme oxygenase
MTQTPIMDELKSSTTQLHRTAEGMPLEQALIGARIPRHVYPLFLAQRLHLHRRLEAALTQLAEQLPLDGIWSHALNAQAPRLLADLAFFGFDPDSALALPSTETLIASIDRAMNESPERILGILYVLEGSNNGARFVARQLRRAWELTGADGMTFLDPSGDDQPAIWAEFRRRMNELGLTDDQRRAILAAAHETFECIIATNNAIWQANDAGDPALAEQTPGKA